MQIVIHRGTHQIGGCCTEIRTRRGRILIDLGDELPLPGQVPQPLELDGVTCGAANCGGIFFTHYHGDHVGQLSRILPGIPLYMGSAAKDIFTLYQQRIAAHHPSAALETLTAIRPLHPLGCTWVEDMKITPLAVDHSAYDAYMFLVEAEGKRILHTGDYRLHGFRGKGVLPALEKYVGQVDLLITEGTTLSRSGQQVMTEHDVERAAIQLMGEKKYTFLLCSSTNIDRLAAFLAAAKKTGRLFVCDSYQKSILDVATRHSGDRSSLYDFSCVLTYGENLLPMMRQRGFCMPIRGSQRDWEQLGRFAAEQSILVYSMWPGYLEQDPELKGSVESRNAIILHASGHGGPEQIKAVCDTVRPRLGVVPIHTDAPERLAVIISPWQTIAVEDGAIYDVE